MKTTPIVDEVREALVWYFEEKASYREWVSANTSRTVGVSQLDKCQYLPITPGSPGWAADNPLPGSVFDWPGPCAAA